jgi:hypothetical protein
MARRNTSRCCLGWIAGAAPDLAVCREQGGLVLRGFHLAKAVALECTFFPLQLPSRYRPTPVVRQCSTVQASAIVLCMRTILSSFLLAFTLAVASAEADCWIIGHRDNGAEIWECRGLTRPLPVCGSEFDTGDQCVVRHPAQQQPGISRPHAQGRRADGSTTGRVPSGATGNTPFNAGGSWPNGAERYARGGGR